MWIIYKFQWKLWYLFFYTQHLSVITFIGDPQSQKIGKSNNLKVFQSKKTEGHKKDSHTWQRSHMAKVTCGKGHTWQRPHVAKVTYASGRRTLVFIIITLFMNFKFQTSQIPIQNFLLEQKIVMKLNLF